MEWLGHRPAHHAGGGTVRVLTWRLVGRCACAVLLACAPGGPAAAQTLAPAQAETFTAGVKALSDGRVEAAEAAFRTVLRDGGNLPFVHHNLGIALQRLGRHAEAVESFRAASRGDARFGPARLLAGTSLLALGEARAAVDELAIACRLMPEEPAAHLQHADACERLGDAVCLTDEYRTLVRLMPSNAEYTYRLGKAYLRLSQWAHERMQTIDASAPEVKLALGREWLQQGRADLAERAFAEATASNPAFVEGHVALARLHLDARRFAEAASAAERALALVPRHREAGALLAAARAGR